MSARTAALAPAAPGDLELARRAAGGDHDAFARIMRANNRALFRTARAILHDDADAEDCVQAAYLLAYRGLGGFAGQSKLSTWLTRIVVNEAIGRARRVARRGVVVPIGAPGDDRAIDALASAAPGPEDEAMRAELRRLIERRIDALPEAFRAVFVLRALEEMPVEETAAALGIPEATVRTRFFRARGLLRESLARDIDQSLEGAFAFDGARCDRLVAAVLQRLQAEVPTTP